MDQIEQLLGGADEELRIKGVAHLNGISGGHAFRLILRALGDESWRVRKSAAEILSRWNDTERVVAALVDCMRSEDNAGLRNAAVETLERIGRDAVPALLSVVDDEDHDLRKLVIDILGAIGDRRATPCLIRALGDPDENVRSSAAENLGRIADDEAIGSLLDVLKTDDLLLKFSALEALSRIGRAIPVEAVSPHLKNPLLKKAALEALGRSGSLSALPFLAEGIEDRAKSVREAALIALAELVGAMKDKEPPIHFLRERKGVLAERAASCLESGRPEVVSAVLRFLGWTQSAEFIPAMIGLAADDLHTAAVAETIAGFGRRGGSYLIEAYRNAPEAQRPFICFLLGEIGAEGAAPLLLDALGSDVGHERHSAAAALGKIGEMNAVEKLFALMEDEYIDVREAAVQSLIMLAGSGRDAVVGQLRRCADTDRAVLRRNCASLLSGIAGAADFDLALAFLKDESPFVRKSAVDALALIGTGEAARQIILALSDEERDVRIAAAAALGRMHCAEAMRPLLSLLQDDDIWVKSAAIRSIAAIGGKDASSHLLPLLKDEVGLTVITALEVLGAMAAPEYGPLMLETMKSADTEVLKAAISNLAYWEDDRLRQALSSMLEHESWEVRNAAVSVLGEKGGAQDLARLKQRLAYEEDELVRQAIKKVIDGAGE